MFYIDNDFNVDYYSIPYRKELCMRTVQMILDDKLIALVDKTVKRLRTTRSAFTRAALREAINRLNVDHLEKKHRQGYKIHPVNKKEFSTA